MSCGCVLCLWSERDSRQNHSFPIIDSCHQYMPLCCCGVVGNWMENRTTSTARGRPGKFVYCINIINVEILFKINISFVELVRRWFWSAKFYVYFYESLFYNMKRSFVGVHKHNFRPLSLSLKDSNTPNPT